MTDFLPPRIQGCLRHLNVNLLYELRIRADKPLSVNVGGRFYFLGEDGFCSSERALRPTKEEIEDALLAASGYSVYAVEDQLRRGFVTAKGGERVGIAGTVVSENGSVHSVRDVTSLCVRIPHEIRGCADEVYARCLGDGLRSVLLMAPPGEGKTTILRELIRLVAVRTERNILVGDERGELSVGDLGDTTDVIRFADKQTAFTAGIRAMRPEVIATDELLPEDYTAVRRAVESGIAVLASAHLKRFEDVPQKLFERYVLLDGLGCVGEILDGEGNHVD